MGRVGEGKAGGNGRDDVGREVGKGRDRTGKGVGMTLLTVHQCWQVWVRVRVWVRVSHCIMCIHKYHILTSTFKFHIVR